MQADGIHNKTAIASNNQQKVVLMWGVFDEHELDQDGNEFKVRLSTFAVELEVNMFLIPCGERPSAFRLRGIVDSRESAIKLIHQLHSGLGL